MQKKMAILCTYLRLILLAVPMLCCHVNGKTCLDRCTNLYSDCITSELKTLELTVYQLAKQVEELKNIGYNKTAIGFSAYMTAGHLYPSPGDKIPFNTIELNIGGHYNATNSTFTCPVKGYYFFSFSIFSGAMSGQQYIRTDASLLIDGVKKMQVHGAHTDKTSHGYHQGSNSMLLECSAGSRVWIQTEAAGNHMHGEVTLPTTTFTGFLVYM